jgi:hypothetical protein
MVLLAEQYRAAGDNRSAVLWLRRAISDLGENAKRYPVNLQFLLGEALGALKDMSAAAVALEAAKRHPSVEDEPQEIDGMLASVYNSLQQNKRDGLHQILHLGYVRVVLDHRLVAVP